jgi:hypothetical protein
MAIVNSIHAADIVRRVAELVREEPSVRSLYYRQSGEVAEFWLLSEPIDRETERQVRQIRRTLFDKFPDALFEFHLINPRLSEGLDPPVLIPEDATLVTML